MEWIVYFSGPIGVLLIAAGGLFSLRSVYREEISGPKNTAIIISVTAGIFLVLCPNLVSIDILGIKAELNEARRDTEEIAEYREQLEKSKVEIERIEKVLSAKADVLEASAERFNAELEDSTREITKRIETIARYLEDEMAQLLERQLSADEISRKLTGHIQSATEAISELGHLQELLRVSIRAYSNSRADLEHLFFIGYKSQRPEKDLARAIYDSLIKRPPTLDLVYIPSLDWLRRDDLEKIPPKDFLEIYESQSDPRRLLQLLMYIDQNQSWRKQEKNNLLVPILRDEQNLAVLEAAGKTFNRVNGLSFYPLEYKAMLDWWEKEGQGEVPVNNE